MCAQPYDPTLKALVETAPADWLALAGEGPAPVELIDADIATVSGAADKVLRVRSDPEWLLHLEFQAGHDAAELPGLLHVRNALLDHRHGLPVLSLVVVLRPEADSPQLTGTRERTLPRRSRRHLAFEYEVCRVWQLDSETLLRGGLGTLPLAPISNVTEGQLPGIIQRIERRLSRPTRKKEATTLWGATYILMGLRYSAEVARRLLEGVAGMRESTTYQAILEEGQVLQSRKLLLNLGVQRFGPPDAATQTALEGIRDLARWEELFARVLTASSWQDLLGETPAPPRRSRRRS